MHRISYTLIILSVSYRNITNILTNATSVVRTSVKNVKLSCFCIYGSCKLVWLNFVPFTWAFDYMYVCLRFVGHKKWEVYLMFIDVFNLECTFCFGRTFSLKFFAEESDVQAGSTWECDKITEENQNLKLEWYWDSRVLLAVVKRKPKCLAQAFKQVYILSVWVSSHAKTWRINCFHFKACSCSLLAPFCCFDHC